MREDFDALVADRFTLLDDVPVPDTWSRVQRSERLQPGLSAEDVMTMIDLETPSPTDDHQKGSKRLLVAALAAAAAVVAIAVVVTRDADDGPPADQPSPTVTVPSTVPPRALFGSEDEELVPGTYFVDEVDGTPMARIYVTIGARWWTMVDASSLDKHGGPYPADDIGHITFSRPDQVYVDACHLSDGFHRGPVTTVDGLVAALIEQDGWADVTAPSDISVDGYPGKTFQRTAPAVISDCPNMTPGHMRLPELGDDGLKSWQNEDDSNLGGSYYEPGQVETLLVLDIDGTVVVIHANLWAGASVADRAEFAGVLDSIRIDPRPLPNVPGRLLEPGTYYVDEVDGTPTPRIFATLESGWTDPDAGEGWVIAKGGTPDEGGIGLMTITNPVSVFSDACHPTDGFHPGSVATVDGLVTALREQQGGWVDVTAPSDISVGGYLGKAFQRTAPAVMSGCTTRDGGSSFSGGAVFPSWETAEGINGGYAPGQIETLWILDIDGTVVVISTELWPRPSATAHADFADAVLDSIRIDRP